MHDLVIRRGTVVDGTGAPRREVDIAIDEGLITSLEPKAGRARRELNADGLLVTPGWVDIHTHYDGLRQLRRGVRAGSPWQRDLSHQPNGRRGRHSRDCPLGRG